MTTYIVRDTVVLLKRSLTAGRSVLFSGITVAVSLAALIALPVPFLRSVGYTGLLIPIISVAAALTPLPALLAVAGPDSTGHTAAPPTRPAGCGTASARLWYGTAGSRPARQSS